jgi:hypothetical protein
VTWTFTLRDGLTFHDGERVLAKDCAMSVRRWGSRDSFGRPLLAATNDIETIDGVTRRTSREPVNQGGWSCFITQIEGVAACTPGGSFELRGNGAKAWFGWPDDEELERLRTAWTPDLPAQKAIAEKVQMRALETLPCIAWATVPADSVPSRYHGHRESGVPAVLGGAPGVTTGFASLLKPKLLASAHSSP